MERFRGAKRPDRHAINAWERFVAQAHDKAGPAPLPPKAHRIRRADGKPIQATEHQLQAALISWWWRECHAFALPVYALFAIPNGGARNPITGSNLKAEGVRRGTPDLMLAVPKCGAYGLFIEMKAGDNKPSPEQTEFLNFLEERGYRTTVQWTTEGAIVAIKEYLA